METRALDKLLKVLELYVQSKPEQTLKQLNKRTCREIIIKTRERVRVSKLFLRFLNFILPNVNYFQFNFVKSQNNKRITF